jgi:hypothetical protein
VKALLLSLIAQADEESTGNGGTSVSGRNDALYGRDGQPYPATISSTFTSYSAIQDVHRSFEINIVSAVGAHIKEIVLNSSIFPINSSFSSNHTIQFEMRDLIRVHTLKIVFDKPTDQVKLNSVTL